MPVLFKVRSYNWTGNWNRATGSIEKIYKKYANIYIYPANEIIRIKNLTNRRGGVRIPGEAVRTVNLRSACNWDTWNCCLHSWPRPDGSCNRTLGGWIFCSGGAIQWSITRGGQTAILVSWSAVRCPAYYQNDSGTVLANYRHGASVFPLFCIFWPIFKNIPKRINYQIMELIPILILILRKSELRNSELRNSELWNSELRNSEQRNGKLCHAVDYSEYNGSGIAELQTSSSGLQWK
jgi:hypothetical protein